MRELILRISTITLLVVGCGQLAASQIHIGASTKVFANQIGMYLFMFMIFGLTTGFNAILLEKPRSLVSFIFSSVLAVVSGVIYLRLLQADIASQEALTMADVSGSWQLAVAAIAIYAIGLLVVPFLSWPDIKRASGYAR